MGKGRKGARKYKLYQGSAQFLNRGNLEELRALPCVSGDRLEYRVCVRAHVYAHACDHGRNSENESECQTY
jgi:hypothetical protein